MGRLRIDRLTGPPAPLVRADGRVVVARCHRARTPLARAIGLLFTSDLRPDEGLWLEPCSSVHALGLRARIGCAFLDAGGRVLRVVDPLPPGRAAGARGARVVVEAPAGVLAASLRPGEVVGLGQCAAPSPVTAT
ncbi:MAG TPA: DUF192 domain-containing protein [Miltoncostaeaceae bacterium]|nr:DUF192 domain-containing protein [Miltoncostaeaceae bacterium]